MRKFFLSSSFVIAAFALAGCDTASQQSDGGAVSVDEIAEYERLNDAAQAQTAAEEEAAP